MRLQAWLRMAVLRPRFPLNFLREFRNKEWWYTGAYDPGTGVYVSWYFVRVNAVPKGRAEFPTIGRDRADLVVAGCAILESIFDIWPGERLGVADRGIREGILRALMASDAKRRTRRN